MEDNETTAESQGQDSQITSENVEGFQQCVTEIQNLIEQDENLSEMTPEIYNCKKSELTNLVTELSRMYEALADQHVDSIKEVSKNTQKFTTPIKTQHVVSSTSTSPQIGQTSRTPEFMTPVGFDFTLHTGGGFDISTRDGSESSFTLSSDSESTCKHPNSPVNYELSKSKETKVNDPKALLKKISTLEKEVSNMKKKIQHLTDENAILEAEKANMADLKLVVSKSNRKIETMLKVLEASRQQILTADEENTKLQNVLSSKVFDLTHRLRELGLLEKNGETGEAIESLEKQFDTAEGRDLKLQEKTERGLAGIAERDERITDLNAHIKQLETSHAAEEDKLNNDIEWLKTELLEQCLLVDELMVKKMELERELFKQREAATEDAV